LTKKVRRKSVDTIAKLLLNEIEKSEFKIAGVSEFSLNQFTGRYMLHFLARMTRFVEGGSGKQSRFEDYVDRSIANPYDIEHIWADKPDEHKDECPTPHEFQYARNRFGGLLLLPRDINRSLQAKPYPDKLNAYLSQNLLAASLDLRCYQNNPQFKGFFQGNNLAFEPMAQFKKADMDTGPRSSQMRHRHERRRRPADERITQAGAPEPRACGSGLSAASVGFGLVFFQFSGGTMSNHSVAWVSVTSWR
jgi:hypothetical protein